MIGWDIGLFFLLVFFFGLDAKAEEQVQTTLKKLIVFNGFANEEYILIYTYGFWLEKNEVNKLSHMQKSCTPTAPCSVKLPYGKLT